MLRVFHTYPPYLFLISKISTRVLLIRELLFTLICLTKSCLNVSSLADLGVGISVSIMSASTGSFCRVVVSMLSGTVSEIPSRIAINGYKSYSLVLLLRLFLLIRPFSQEMLLSE